MGNAELGDLHKDDHCDHDEMDERNEALLLASWAQDDSDFDGDPPRASPTAMNIHRRGRRAKGRRADFRLPRPSAAVQTSVQTTRRSAESARDMRLSSLPRPVWCPSLVIASQRGVAGPASLLFDDGATPAPTPLLRRPPREGINGLALRQ